MRIRIRIPQVLAAVGVLALAAVGVAVLAQYAFDMQPCPWCVLQRFIYLVVAVLAFAGALLSKHGAPRRHRAGAAGRAERTRVGAVAATGGRQRELVRPEPGRTHHHRPAPGPDPAAAVHRLRVVRGRRGLGAAHPVRGVELRDVTSSCRCCSPGRCARR